MKIEIAKTAGFCMGVRRAVKFTLDASKKQNSPIYTYGPLIHNPQVLNLFSKKGISIINNIPKRGIGTVIVRAHGAPPDVKIKLKNAGFVVVDATCPHVARVQSIIKINSKKGYATIIVGDRDHPEVKGLLGYSNSNVHVIGNINELEKKTLFKKAIVVAQTTQDIEFYKQVKKWIISRKPHYKLFNTICNSTEKRQLETKILSNNVDVIIVVGGNQSGNTKRLVEIAKTYGKVVLHIENESELGSYSFLSSFKKIGITAGASTPSWTIKKIYDILKRNY